MLISWTTNEREFLWNLFEAFRNCHPYRQQNCWNLCFHFDCKGEEVFYELSIRYFCILLCHYLCLTKWWVWRAKSRVAFGCWVIIKALYCIWYAWLFMVLCCSFKIPKCWWHPICCTYTPYPYLFVEIKIPNKMFRVEKGMKFNFLCRVGEISVVGEGGWLVYFGPTVFIPPLTCCFIFLFFCFGHIRLAFIFAALYAPNANEWLIAYETPST